MTNGRTNLAFSPIACHTLIKSHLSRGRITDEHHQHVWLIKREENYDIAGERIIK